MVGDLAHFWCSSSDPLHVPLKYKNSFGHKGGRRERLGAVKHAKRCRISARFFLEGSRGLKKSTLFHQKRGQIQKKSLVIYYRRASGRPEAGHWPAKRAMGPLGPIGPYRAMGPMAPWGPLVGFGLRLPEKGCKVVKNGKLGWIWFKIIQERL